MDAKTVSLAVFILSYILFVALPKKRSLVAVIGAILLVLSRTLSPEEAFFAINWNVMGIFIGTLAVADIFMESRVPAYLAELIVDRARNTCWAILYICVLTGFISAFVENVPLLAAMLPVAISMSQTLGINPSLFLFGLLIGTSLGGNITPIGASANIVASGLLRKEGHPVRFMEFTRIGLPFTLAAVAAAYAFIWLVWK